MLHLMLPVPRSHTPDDPLSHVVRHMTLTRGRWRRSLSFLSSPRNQPRVGLYNSGGKKTILMLPPPLPPQASIVQSCLKRRLVLLLLRMEGEYSPSRPPPLFWRFPPHDLITEDITLSPPPPPLPPPLPLPPPSPRPVLVLLAPPTLLTATPRSPMSSTQMTVRMSHLMGSLCRGVACCQGHRAPPPSSPRTVSRMLRGCSVLVPEVCVHLPRWSLLTLSPISFWATSHWRLVKTAQRTLMGKTL